MSKKMLLIAATILLAFSARAADLSVDEIISKVQANQDKIQDLYAETTTTMTTDLAMPGQERSGPQKNVQKARLWAKGADKTKTEVLSPTKQITITNGDRLAVIDPVSGQKTVQDLKKKSGTLAAGGQMTLEKAKEFFYFSVRQTAAASAEGGAAYIITGVPKQRNQFMGKIEFYVGGKSWLPAKIMIYDPKSKPMTQTELEYSSIDNVYVPLKNRSVVSSPLGKMEVAVEYDAVKINRGISDDEFKI